jgi:hypothetical protein
MAAAISLPRLKQLLSVSYAVLLLTSEAPRAADSKDVDGGEASDREKFPLLFAAGEGDAKEVKRLLEV